MKIKPSIYKISSVLIGSYLIFVWSFYGISQNIEKENKKMIVGGIGNYEYLHCGFNFKNIKDYYIETSIGLKPWEFKDEKYFMYYLAFGHEFQGKSEKQRVLFPSLQIKLLIWSLENKHNYFLFLGIIPEAGLRYKLSDRFSLKGNVGIARNLQLKYKRKTYDEVGWPMDWQPSFSFQINYKLR